MTDLTLRGDYFLGQFHSTHNKNDEYINKICPADTSLKLWETGIDYSHCHRVIDSAIEGYKTWRKLSLDERANYLERFKSLVDSKIEHIAMAIALETGKPLWEAMTEASAVSAKVGVTLKDSRERISPKFIKEVLPNIDGHIIYKPIGPSLVIGPFNFPCHLANGQILSALLSGNTIIFKPSEKTIVSSQILIECFHDAGFPPGVVNFINGTAHTTQAILKHPAIKGIFFTGSLAVGKKILEAVGTDVTKLVALELGGKNTTIVHKDANLDHAMVELLRSCYLTSGQRCTSTSMITVHEDIAQEFMEKFKAATERIIVDHPTKAKSDPFMGPVIDEMAKQKYLDSLELGKRHGAQAIIENKELKLEYEGYYVNPTIYFIDEVKKSNPYTQEEIFAPHVTVSHFKNIEQAIDIANITEYGLAAAIFTNDKNIYQKALNEIDAGIINLNRSTVGASSRLPFGGVKNSGNYHPAAVSMIDHTVSAAASLETLDLSSKIEDVKGLRS